MAGLGSSGRFFTHTSAGSIVWHTCLLPLQVAALGYQTYLHGSQGSQGEYFRKKADKAWSPMICLFSVMLYWSKSQKPIWIQGEGA